MTPGIGILAQCLYIIYLVSGGTKCFLLHVELAKNNCEALYYITKRTNIVFKIANPKMHNKFAKIDKQTSMKILHT